MFKSIEGHKMVVIEKEIERMEDYNAYWSIGLLLFVTNDFMNNSIEFFKMIFIRFSSK